MKKIVLSCFLLLIALPVSSQGEVISYRMYITSGGANTGGGIAGNGMGYLSLKGRFNLIIDYDAGLVNLENINISFNNRPSYLNWNALKGTFNNGNIYLSSPNPINDINNYLSGPFDGSTAFLHGALSDGFIDGFGYDCNFTAVVIPVSYAGGEIVTWVAEQSGELNTSIHSLDSVPSPNTDFIAIAAGQGHLLGLKDNGSIVAWGDNASGQSHVPSPNTGFKAVAAGNFHSLGLEQNGSVVAWGWNSFGQSRVPLPNRDFNAIAAGAFHSLGLKQDGSIVAWGYNRFGQCYIPVPNTGFRAITSGVYHSLGLKQDGSIVAWGRNSEGQCTVPEPNMDFKAVAAGHSHSLGLKQDGSIATWGRDSEGQCDVPSPNTEFIAIAAGLYHSLGLKQDGSVIVWGADGAYQSTVPKPNTGFTSIATGAYHSLGLKSNIVITKCKVTSGKMWQGDAFALSGDITLPEDLDFNNVYQIDVNLISLTDGASVYRETVYSSAIKGKFKYTYKIPRAAGGAITSLIVDSGKKLFSIKARKVGLIGLACPLRMELTLVGPVTGEHKLSGDAYESIVNGRKIIPICLMRQYKNILVVTGARLRDSSRPLSDSLLVTGWIAVENISDANLYAQDVDIVWGDQLFTIPAGSLKAAGTGHLYKCSKIAAKGNKGLIKAEIDLDRCTFKIKISGATIDADSGIVPFYMVFTGFDETVKVNID